MRHGLQSLHPGPGDLLIRHVRIIVQFADVDSLLRRDSCSVYGSAGGG